MKHTPRQILMDLAELQEIETELAQLRAPANGEELSELEHQEATGILLTRALNNPDIFRQVRGPIDLGKYKAIFVSTATAMQTSMIRVKFERS